jgi:thiopurine S-methyltransferase
MQAEFWHERWSNNQIGFHESAVNPLLAKHFAALGVVKPARVFLPLCGKTLDIDWLLSNGYRVAGAELSPLAVAALFDRLGLKPAESPGGMAGEIACWSAAGLDVFVGDIFALSASTLGRVDAVYDRAALIALPPDMRARYAAHLDSLANGAAQLLITLDYDQSRMSGPPFAVSDEEVRRLYSGRAPVLLSTQEMPGGLKGQCPATENAWLLQQRLG